jgi:hypothetical protein
MDFIFSGYKRWHFTTAISIGCKEYQNWLVRFYTTMARVSSESGGFASV